MAFSVLDGVLAPEWRQVRRLVDARSSSELNSDDRDDIAQEIFIESVRAADGDLAKARTYLASNVRRPRFYTRARERNSRHRSVVEVTDGIASAILSPGVLCQQGLPPRPGTKRSYFEDSRSHEDFGFECLDLLRRALADMPNDQAAAFLLVRIQQETYDHAARVLRVSKATVFNLVARADNAIRTAWHDAEAA